MAQIVDKASGVWVVMSACIGCASETAPTGVDVGTSASVATTSVPAPSSSSVPATTVPFEQTSTMAPEPAPTGAGESTPWGSETHAESSAAHTSSSAYETSESHGQSAGGDAGDAALADLEAYLDTPRAERPPFGEQSFTTVGLSLAQSDAARDILWQDHVAFIRETRAAEHEQKSITRDGFTLRYDYTTFGAMPADGHSLYISLHGGGETEAAVNDDQWENQKQLYQPAEGIYLSPRAPTDTWNMWHQDHIDPLFERLVENFVALEGVNPNRVYVMGYSAGGDGVYQLGPRMADHWAAAAAMAGHPNEAKPFSLRNIGFTIHVGGDDTAFDRNLVAVEWRDQLLGLRADDPTGYEHVVEVHEGKPHWMDLEDAVAVPWMAQFTRNPTPSRVVWYQDDILHPRFYWLRDLQPEKETTLTAELSGQRVTIESGGVKSFAVMLSDALLDLDLPVTVVRDGTTVSEDVLLRTIGNLQSTLVERGDPALMFPAHVVVAP